MRRQALISLGAGLLVLGGCGGSDASSATPAETVTADSATPGTAPTASSDGAATEPSDATTGTTGAGTATTTAGQDDVGDRVDPAAVSGEVCSTDGSPTDLSPLDGDVPEVPVDPAFEGSPLPSVTLRRINCDPGFVNLKNEAPGTQPVLYWFWAPF